MWDYALGDGFLDLQTPEHSVFRFTMPSELDGVFETSKQTDVSPVSFGKKGRVGRAQIHSAAPGKIHLTLSSEADTPTLTFSRNGDKWYGTPKISEEFDKAAFEMGMSKQAGLGDKIFNLANEPYKMLIHNPATFLYKNMLMGPAAGIRQDLGEEGSTGAALLGLGAGAAYDLGRRTFYNTRAENREEGFGRRALRYALPAASLGLYDMAAKNTFKNHFEQPEVFGPQYRETGIGRMIRDMKRK